jgi:hypothetical protein
MLNSEVDALSRSRLRLRPTTLTQRIILSLSVLLSLRVLPSLPPLVRLREGRPNKARTLSLLVARQT